MNEITDQLVRKGDELAGKVCVVTGAGTGIGAAIAGAFAAQGARVAVLDRDEVGAERTQQRLSNTGAEARAYRVDVTDEEGVIASVTRVQEDFGGVDVLVNNAGIGLLGTSMTLPTQDWQRSLDVMATGVFFCSREYGKALRDNGGGTIVNISSINAISGFPMRLAYSAAKAAVISITKILAVEWSGYGIRVNAVAPGMTATDMMKSAINDGLVDYEGYIALTPLKRFGEPREIAEAVLFLASERSSFITGHVIVADGGWTAFGWTPWSGDPEAPGIADTSPAS